MGSKCTVSVEGEKKILLVLRSTGQPLPRSPLYRKPLGSALGSAGNKEQAREDSMGEKRTNSRQRGGRERDEERDKTPRPMFLTTTRKIKRAFEG